MTTAFENFINNELPKRATTTDGTKLLELDVSALGVGPGNKITWTVPNRNIDLGHAYIGATHSTGTSYERLTFNRADGTSDLVDINFPTDGTWFIQNTSDTSKHIAFDASSVGHNQRRVISMPDANVNLGKVPVSLSFSGGLLTLTQVDGSTLTSGISTSLTPITGNTTLQVGSSYYFNVPSGGVTLGLPASPSGNDYILIYRGWYGEVLPSGASVSDILVSGVPSTVNILSNQYSFPGSVIKLTYDAGYSGWYCTTQNWQNSIFQRHYAVDLLGNLDSGGHYVSIIADGAGRNNALTGNRILEFADFDMNLDNLKYIPAINFSNSNIVASPGNSAVVAGTGNHSLGASSFIGTGTANEVRSVSSAIVSGNANTIYVSANYSVIGGGTGNTVSDVYSFLGGGEYNSVSSDHGAIAGGWHNTAGNYAGIISGGYNTASGIYSVVAGGSTNTASGNYSVVAGGSGNTAASDRAVVGGGRTNSVSSSNFATISGGEYNSLYTATDGVIAGGNSNSISGNFAAILGGAGNIITSGQNSSIVGGAANSITSFSSFIGGGGSNTVSSGYSTIAGGYLNSCSGSSAGILSGNSNTVTGALSAIVGGASNIIDGTDSGIVAGTHNSISHQTHDSSPDLSGIVAGTYNAIAGFNSFIGAGEHNTISFPAGGSCHSTILNGSQNSITNTNFSAILNGSLNSVTGGGSVVVNGSSNTISGSQSVIISGKNNSISAPYQVVLTAGSVTDLPATNSIVFGSSGTSNTFATTVTQILPLRLNIGVGTEGTYTLSADGTAIKGGQVSSPNSPRILRDNLNNSGIARHEVQLSMWSEGFGGGRYVFGKIISHWTISSYPYIPTKLGTDIYVLEKPTDPTITSWFNSIAVTSGTGGNANVLQIQLPLDGTVPDIYNWTYVSAVVTSNYLSG